MAADASNPAIQSVGKYDLVEKIAEGGMGTVYRGRNRETGETVAVKVVSSNMTGNEVLLKRFAQEYNAARQLDHPNIVKALDYGETGDTPYLVMEFVEGQSLGQKIDREGALAEKEAIRIIGQVAQGLYRAHREKLIHRDVKPDNIMLTKDGLAKLTDLGLVKETAADLNLTRTGRGLGTPHFMAPEQFKNAKNVDPRCDIYSLGATLYMMVTGEMPFRSSGPLDAYMKKIENKFTPPRDLVPSLSERVDWAIRRAMSADPDQRPSSCREFVEDLTGRSTRKAPAIKEAAQPQEIWYLVYKDEDGSSHTVRGSSGAIRRSLKEGLLGDASNIRAGRSKEGGFEPLREYPEFRDLVVGAAPLVTKTPRPTATESPKARNKGTQPSPNDPTLLANQQALPSRPEPKFEPKPATRKSWPVWVQCVIILGLVSVGALIGWLLFGR